jgi:predicted dehydrogenase
MRGIVTIGIVGAGFGQQVHAPAFRSSPGCELGAICASRLERARQAAQTLGIPKATDDWRELVADPDIHALALAVPPSLQADIALAAAQAGKHLFCEKPLALNVSQAQGILTAARQAKIVHAMDFIFPEIGAWQKAQELLRSSVLGRIRHAALTWRVETYAYRAKTDNWKTREASGGGTLNNLASHTFYYLEWLLGPIENVLARLAPREAEVEARVDAWIEFANGFSGTVSIAADAFLGSGHRLEVYGDLGTLVLENPTMDHARGFKLSLGTRAAPQLAAIETPNDDTHADGRVYPVSRIAGRFIEAIRSGGTAVPNLENGLRVQVLLDALRLADRSGSWQAVGAG